MRKEFLVLIVAIFVAACNSTNNSAQHTDSPCSHLMDRAMSHGLQGWVRLSFDITEKGNTDNIEVIDSSHANIFDEAAICSLLQWKYKPKIQDGTPVRQTNQTVQLDFKYE